MSPSLFHLRVGAYGERPKGYGPKGPCLTCFKRRTGNQPKSRFSFSTREPAFLCFLERRTDEKKYFNRTFIFLFLFKAGPVFSGDLADKALLEILESKGFLTEKEVREVKTILNAEQKNEKRQENKGVEVVYDEGLRIRSKDKKNLYHPDRGRFETDLLVFSDHYPVDNDFDIRRARFF